MLTEPKYDRFWNDLLTPSEKPAMSSKVAAATPSPPPPAAPLAHPCPPSLGEEQEAVTTFCMLIPRMPQWKFSSPSAFLSRSPSSASKELSAAAKTESPGEAGTGSASPSSSSGLAAVLSACEPVCAAPCSLQVMNRLRGGARGGRKAPQAEGAKLAGEEWSRKGSFISKPVQGWLHPDERVLGPGVSYVVRYMGCIEILRSMRSLDFNTRTQVTKEAINRLYETVPGVKGTWKRKAPNKALFSILGKSNLRFAGISIVVNISIDGLNLMIPTTRQIIANHHMQSISFASGGDTDTTDYVAYVAKDPINQRACHILECCDGLAQSVINTVGQAFELRFKQYLHSPPKTMAPQDRAMGTEEATWGEDDETSEHDYYNSIPGKEPPLGGLVDSRLWPGTSLCHAPTQLSCSSHFGQGAFTRLRPNPSTPQSLSSSGPFEDALKLHESMSACGAGSSPPIEDQWPSPPTRKAPIAPTEDQLKQEPWYHGKMSRRDAERLLQTDGDFLVRDSITNPGQYVLTGMHNGQPKHLLLVDPEGVVRTKDALFESISHLINYHLQNQQPIVAAESELHLRQVVKGKL
uniref:SHC-transforming protein 2 n=1 Tax=Euleptes europaea TaxID=460621 RepID=UPI00253F7349|nr:SHC-transforming protein 2 [Euleptes europaea]